MTDNRDSFVLQENFGRERRKHIP